MKKYLRDLFLSIDKLALKYGWVSDWEHFTPREIDDLLKEWENISIEEIQKTRISDFFVKMYTANNFRNIEHLLSGWEKNPIFNERMLIFRDCLFALQNSLTSFNPSNLVVPVLISQIDGIIGELLKREGYIYDKTAKVWIPPPNMPNERKRGRQDRVIGNLIHNKRNRTGRTYVGNLIHMNSRYEIINEGLFQESFRGKPLNNLSIISRHQILHGEDFKYGTVQNTLKLFLILDYLSKFDVTELVEPNDNNLADFRDPSNW